MEGGGAGGDEGGGTRGGGTRAVAGPGSALLGEQRSLVVIQSQWTSHQYLHAFVSNAACSEWFILSCVPSYVQLLSNAAPFKYLRL